MVKVLNATQSRGEIESILTRAREQITIISPYIKISDELLARLADAGRRKIKITLVCREKDLKEGERAKVESIPNLNLCFNDRVHTKCFFNETSMVITSLNLYDSSYGDNHEMGVYLSEEVASDKQALQDAKTEAGFIIREPTLGFHHETPNPKQNKAPSYQAKEPSEPSLVRDIAQIFGLSKQTQGHCIRCGESIPLDKTAPYCPKCYKTWAKYGDEEYAEKVCHNCGKPSKTSKKAPLCLPCFKGTR